MLLRKLVILALVCGLSACQSKKPDELPPYVVLDTPMELDPTQQRDLSGWWSDGTQMLKLDEASGFGSYARFTDMNRYHEPVEHGRWRQSSYAVVWLEPYSAIEREPKRVAVSMNDGRLALTIGEGAPMFSLKAPPPVLEDRLVGRWIGPSGVLTLSDSMRYVFTGPGEPQPNVLNGHSGIWMLRGTTITLVPDSPALEPSEYQVNDVDGAITLGSQDYELKRPQPTGESAGS